MTRSTKTEGVSHKKAKDLLFSCTSKNTGSPLLPSRAAASSPARFFKSMGLDYLE